MARRKVESLSGLIRLSRLSRLETRSTGSSIKIAAIFAFRRRSSDDGTSRTKPGRSRPLQTVPSTYYYHPKPQNDAPDSIAGIRHCGCCFVAVPATDPFGFVFWRRFDFRSGAPWRVTIIVLLPDLSSCHHCRVRGRGTASKGSRAQGRGCRGREAGARQSSFQKGPARCRHRQDHRPLLSS